MACSSLSADYYGRQMRVISVYMLLKLLCLTQHMNFDITLILSSDPISFPIIMVVIFSLSFTYCC